MNLCPPVAILHRQKSTYTLVRKNATTSVQRVEMSYDGSLVAFLVAADTRFENTLQVMNHMQSPRSRKSSGLVGHDKVLVLEVQVGSASRLERVTGWLNEYGMLAE
jgi:hypothetical protein